MPVDFDDFLYGPLHDEFGSTGTVTPITSAAPAEVVMVEETVGAELGFDAGAVATVRPAACVRISALVEAGLTRRDLGGAGLVLNGRTYQIESSEPRPSPTGEDTGELVLLLMEV